MSHREEVLRQAMALPMEYRAYVVTVLERSLNEGEVSTCDPECPNDGVSGNALLTELERRSAAYRAGATTARSAADVVAGMKSRQSNETST